MSASRFGPPMEGRWRVVPEQVRVVIAAVLVNRSDWEACVARRCMRASVDRVQASRLNQPMRERADERGPCVA